jgi:hypothetical protein
MYPFSVFASFEAFARNASTIGCNEACAKIAFRCVEDRSLAVQESAVFPINSRFLHLKTEIQSLRCNSAHPTHEFFATKQFLGQEIVLNVQRLPFVASERRMGSMFPFFVLASTGGINQVAIRALLPHLFSTRVASGRTPMESKRF